jgi:hypothetical protein
MFGSRKKKLIFTLLLSLMLSLATTSTVFAGADSDEFCEVLNGGSWTPSGVVPLYGNGDCLFPENSPLALAYCGSDRSALATYTGNKITPDSVECGSAYRPYGRNGDTSEGGKHMLNLQGGRGVTVTFVEGACPQQCTISHNLPVGPSNALPGDAAATLYVRVVDDGGTPGFGSYTACFDTSGLTNPKLYQYLGSGWVLVASGDNNPLCFSSFGDGVFYLGSD